MRDLVLIGNGPSVADYDLKKVGEKYDTIGINGSFIKWMREDWYPTYQFIARYHPEQWGNGVHEFIEKSRGRVKKVFLNTRYYRDETSDNIQRIDVKKKEFLKSPNPEKWADSFDYDLGAVCIQLINEGMKEDEVLELVKKNRSLLNPAFSQKGIYKILKGQQTGDIFSEDYLSKFRYNHNFAFPKTFDDFYVGDFSHSATEAVGIAYILGYRKIYLIGCDNNFVIKNGIMLESSYHDKNMFNGKPYYVKEDIICPRCQKTRGLRQSINKGWEIFLTAMDENEIEDLEIINCSKKSKVPFFRFDKLPL